MISRLYKIERAAKGADAETLQSLQPEHPASLLTELKLWQELLQRHAENGTDKHHAGIRGTLVDSCQSLGRKTGEVSGTFATIIDASAI